MLMEHFLCDDVGGKRNVCEMEVIVLMLKLYTVYL
ncbi:hypothetical protein ATE84_3416 [Aquimarina sp. MAR_2010_214]|nr:hypothetical protein ATE84_3416 [Aquimarina sp. MAR_2010_214]